MTCVNGNGEGVWSDLSGIGGIGGGGDAGYIPVFVGEAGDMIASSNIYRDAGNAVIISNSGGLKGLMLESSDAGENAPFLTWKNGGAEKFSMRYNGSIHKLYLGYGDESGFFPKAAVNTEGFSVTGINQDAAGHSVIQWFTKDQGNNAFLDPGDKAWHVTGRGDQYEDANQRNDLIFWHTGDGGQTFTNALTLDGLGRLGVGTFTPNAKLDVTTTGASQCCADAQEPTMALSETGKQAWLQFHNAGVNEAYIRLAGTFENRYFEIGDNQGVGAGLKIQGDLEVESGTIIMKSGWAIETPDYVFEPDYALPELKEVKNYVERHKHLPGMKSAGEFRETGMDLAEMNFALLAKVEQLYLHIIKQEERIKKLEARVK